MGLISYSVLVFFLAEPLKHIQTNAMTIPTIDDHKSADLFIELLSVLATSNRILTLAIVDIANRLRPKNFEYLYI